MMKEDKVVRLSSDYLGSQIHELQQAVYAMAEGQDVKAVLAIQQVIASLRSCNKYAQEYDNVE